MKQVYRDQGNGGKQATRPLHCLIWNKSISQETQKKSFNCMIENIVSYDTKVWSLPNKRRAPIYRLWNLTSREGAFSLLMKIR